MKYLLDTHALIWIVADFSRLSPTVRQITSRQPPDDFVMAAISLLEISRLAEAGGVNLGNQPKQWLEDASHRFSMIPLSPAIAWRSVNLDWDHRDPADRLICATAIEHQLTLISRDREIHRWGGVNVVW